MLKFHNSLTKKKEDFKPIDITNIRMYVCGPTVYDNIHIGNARPLVVFDSIFRLLRVIYGESAVVYVRNITDIDDKIIARAKEKNESMAELTARTIIDFHNEIAKLNCLLPTHEPRATDNIKEMQDIISVLIDKGFAYESQGHVFFAVEKYQTYGALSGLSQDDIISGARIEVNDLKRHPSDFVLWKPSKEGEPSYSSPWDVENLGGRPGWHLECSAMAKKYLGDSFDIHGGGKDLVFPHHENERAQSCCSSGTKEFANYWLHNGFVMVEGRKMSKSLGNFVTLKKINQQNNAEVVRLTLLGSHYRQPLDFKQESLKQSKNILIKFYEVLLNYQSIEVDSSLQDKEFIDALCDDFNTPKALSILHKRFNELLQGRNHNDLTILKSKIINSTAILGILQSNPVVWLEENNQAVILLSNKEVDDLVKERDEAKVIKDYQKADEIREKLVNNGIIIEDNKEGSKWRRK